MTDSYQHPLSRERREPQLSYTAPVIKTGRSRARMPCCTASTHASATVVLLLASLCLVASARAPPRTLLQGTSSSTADKGAAPCECGKPLGFCGAYIPDGVTCEKGAGWCKAGHSCMEDKDDNRQLKCLPIPKDCGKAGQPCCPSNADGPHTKETPESERLPFCRDGSTCFYTKPSMLGAVSGVPGYACVEVPQDCGKTTNSTCCPSLDQIGNTVWYSATNPPDYMNVNRQECPENMYWQTEAQPQWADDSKSLKGKRFCAGPWVGPSFPGSDILKRPPGVCRPNLLDCGKPGKPCCIGKRSDGALTSVCEAGDGRKGFCATADGHSALPPWTFFDTEGIAKDVLCTACPQVVPETEPANGTQLEKTVWSNCKKQSS